MEVRAFFSSDFKPKTGLDISVLWTVHAKLKIAPLIRRLDSDEVRMALGKMQQFAALGECFAYLYWHPKRAFPQLRRSLSYQCGFSF